jgi:hypothetical protein
MMKMNYGETCVVLPLEQARLCACCDQITNSPTDVCIACGCPGGLMCLANVLNRPQPILVAMERGEPRYD